MAAPGYIQSHSSGALRHKIESGLDRLRCCSICPRNCGIDRTAGESGFCRSGRYAEVSSFAPHFGEERPLAGNRGSGTIFFSHCNLGCVFCQNYSISHTGQGRPVSARRLSSMMTGLQRLGCHNINLVSPSHFVPQILEALPQAIEEGLKIPLVYNTGGYDSLETLALLEGIIDIYMPDIKFSSRSVAAELADAPDYPAVVRKAVLEMYAQVGNLMVNNEGVAEKGLLVRHLVLPEGLAGTRDVMRFIAAEISSETYINIMDQYHPCGDIPLSSPLSRRLTSAEYISAVQTAHDLNLYRLD